MKKALLVLLSICLSIVPFIGGAAYALTEENPQIMQSTTNREVQNSNQRLENLTKITQNDFETEWMVEK